MFRKQEEVQARKQKRREMRLQKKTTESEEESGLSQEGSNTQKRIGNLKNIDKLEVPAKRPRLLSSNNQPSKSLANPPSSKDHCELQLSKTVSAQVKSKTNQKNKEESSSPNPTFEPQIPRRSLRPVI